MSFDIAVQLDVDFVPENLRSWYYGSANSILIIIIRDCPVRISRASREHIHWRPEGARGWTEPLEKTVKRLRTLQKSHAISF